VSVETIKYIEKGHKALALRRSHKTLHERRESDCFRLFAPSLTVFVK
jgi:hypothetical protein